MMKMQELPAGAQHCDQHLPHSSSNRNHVWLLSQVFIVSHHHPAGNQLGCGVARCPCCSDDRKQTWNKSQIKQGNAP